jgi:hypothetical protein
VDHQAFKQLELRPLRDKLVMCFCREPLSLVPQPAEREPGSMAVAQFE